MPKPKLLVIVGLILLVGALGCRGNDEAQMIADSPDIPPNLPPIAPPDFGRARSFQLDDLNGHPVALNDFHMQVVAINFWATWCNPCRKEIPDLVKIQNRFRERGVTVLGLSRDLLNQNGQLVKNEGAVQSFVKEFKINYPVLWDTEDIYNEHYGANWNANYHYSGPQPSNSVSAHRHHRSCHIGCGDNHAPERGVIKP